MADGRVAIVAITRGGARLAARLHAHLPGSDLYVAEQWAGEARAEGAGDALRPFAGSVGALLSAIFRDYRGLVLFLALGAVVRLLAPHLKDKKSDPGVVVVDERGRFAIPVLAGHVGGANDLARRVAAVLGAQAVITTAADAAGTLAVDLLGRESGWTIEPGSPLTMAGAAVVNGEPVGLYQDAGETGWWPADRPLPDNIRVFDDLTDLAASDCRACLVITDRLIPNGDALRRRAVIYRPRSLVVGIGCRRGAAAAAIEAAIHRVLPAHGLSVSSVRNLATVEAKRDEPGLRDCAGRQGVPLEFFPAEALSVVAVPNPSATALRELGTPGVCEPAALLSAGARELVVEKQKAGDVTVAVARIGNTWRR